MSFLAVPSVKRRPWGLLGLMLNKDVAAENPEAAKKLVFMDFEDSGFQSPRLLWARHLSVSASATMCCCGAKTSMRELSFVSVWLTTPLTGAPREWLLASWTGPGCEFADPAGRGSQAPYHYSKPL
jgi:hypothetical protein